MVQATHSGEVNGDAAEDEEPLFLTTAYLTWEKEFYIRLAQKIHRLTVSELDRNEESLFMLFTLHDENLDGTTSRDEMKTLLKQVSGSDTDKEVKEALRAMDTDNSGSVSFIEMLKWWSGENTTGKGPAQSSIQFDLVSAFVGVV